jgi:hypothetical protein
MCTCVYTVSLFPLHAQVQDVFLSFQLVHVIYGEYCVHGKRDLPNFTGPCVLYNTPFSEYCLSVLFYSAYIFSWNHDRSGSVID